MSGEAFLVGNLSLVLPARLASPSRLPFSIILRESRFFVCTSGFVRPALEVRTETDLHLLGLLILSASHPGSVEPVSHAPGDLGNLIDDLHLRNLHDFLQFWMFGTSSSAPSDLHSLCLVTGSAPSAQLGIQLFF